MKNEEISISTTPWKLSEWQKMAISQQRWSSPVETVFKHCSA
jgi:hypothetical protein